jgi:hypothetical protein
MASVDVFFQQAQQVLPIAVLGQRLRQRLQLRGRSSLAPGDFFRAGDLEALAVLQRGDELAGFEQASWVPVSSQA